MAEPGLGAALAFAVRRLRRGWRSGELLILTLALSVAVAALSAVSLFTERVRQAIANQTGETLGADVVFSSRDPLPPELRARIGAAAAATVELVQFPSVVLHGDASALAAIKAVAPGYPLRGTLRISDEPFGAVRVADALPAPGTAWVDQRLWQELGLARGARLQVGAIELTVDGIVENEPDRGNGFADLAPRLMMAHADLASTRLLGTGARAQYGVMAAGDAAQRAALGALELPTDVRRITPQDARPEIRAALQRAGDFLDIAVLAAMLLAAAAIALSAHQHGARLRDEVALLKCLGARSGFIVTGLTLNLLLLGLAAGLGGALVGLGAQALIAQLLGSLLQIALPPPPLAPLAYAWSLGLLLLFGFAVPPVVDARRAPPIRVFQRDLPGAAASRVVWIAAAATAAALLWLQTGEPKLATAVLVGAGGTLLALALLAGLLVWALTPLRRATPGRGFAWRFGLANIARRRGATVAQVIALGLALLALLLVSVVREDLLETWRARLPADTPNQFLINIQSDQVQPLREFFAARGQDDLHLFPMARGRLVALNGTPVGPDLFSDPETQRWINRDFNLSWTDTLGADNRITAGEWWGAAGHGQRWMSADQYAVERLNLKLGDRLTLDFAGEPIEFTVTSFRTVDWDSFRPNFFLLAAPGVLDHVPAQWLTSFYLPREQRTLLRELVREFPNITALDIEQAMSQVRGIMDRIVAAVEFLFLFTLAAGLTVLLAAIEGTRAERARETGLLRTLGARSGMIARGLVAEYATLGLLAGLVAAIAAQAVATTLARQVFKIEYSASPMLWLLGGGGGALLVALLGALALRGVLRTPPKIVLQAPG